MIVPGYVHFGGQHSETAGLGNMLRQAGVVNPHSGDPLGESLLFGIGGGVGGGLFVFQWSGRTSLVLGLRHKWHLMEFVQRAIERLGGTAENKETGKRKVADINLRSAIDAGKPAMVWLDKAS